MYVEQRKKVDSMMIWDQITYFSDKIVKKWEVGSLKEEIKE